MILSSKILNRYLVSNTQNKWTFIFGVRCLTTINSWLVYKWSIIQNIQCQLVPKIRHWIWNNTNKWSIQYFLVLKLNYAVFGYSEFKNLAHNESQPWNNDYHQNMKTWIFPNIQQLISQSTKALTHSVSNVITLFNMG